MQSVVGDNLIDDLLMQLQALRKLVVGHLKSFHESGFAFISTSIGDRDCGMVREGTQELRILACKVSTVAQVVNTERADYGGLRRQGSANDGVDAEAIKLR